MHAGPQGKCQRRIAQLPGLVCASRYHVMVKARVNDSNSRVDCFAGVSGIAATSFIAGAIEKLYTSTTSSYAMLANSKHSVTVDSPKVALTQFFGLFGTKSFIPPTITLGKAY